MTPSDIEQLTSQASALRSEVDDLDDALLRRDLVDLAQALDSIETRAAHCRRLLANMQLPPPTGGDRR